MVTINSNNSTPQPTTLKEEYVQIQTDQIAINGAMQRTYYGEKQQATLQWDWLSPTDYQTLLGFFRGGGTVTYSNTSSDVSSGVFSFTGLPIFTEAEYIQGGTLYRKISAVIRQQ